jgi:hypothetical protein
VPLAEAWTPLAESGAIFATSRARAGESGAHFAGSRAFLAGFDAISARKMGTCGAFLVLAQLHVCHACAYGTPSRGALDDDSGDGCE